MMQRKVDIDFSAGAMSVNGARGHPSTAGSFLTDLNTALGGAGSASYSASGALTLSATGTNEVAVVDPATGGSDKAGKGFSQFFGLNDLVVSSTPYDYANGPDRGRPARLHAGQDGVVQLASSDASQLTNISFTIPPATTMAGLVAALNQPVGGVGLYGTFALSPEGKLAFSSTSGNSLTVALRQQRAGRRPQPQPGFRPGRAGAQRPRRLLFDQVDHQGQSEPPGHRHGRLPASPSAPAPCRPGDIRGADWPWPRPGGRCTASAWPARCTGPHPVGQRLRLCLLEARSPARRTTADTDQTRAEALASEANARRSSVEGVNLDQELVNLTTYQQAYNASTRLIQAAKDMYDACSSA